MKVTIDTQVDTQEDIRKMLQILTGILEKKEINQTADSTSMMDMFNDNPVNDSSSAEKSPDTPPDFSAFLNLAGKKAEKKEEQPRIEYF